jgi:hypothetical protein
MTNKRFGDRPLVTSINYSGAWTTVTYRLQYIQRTISLNATTKWFVVFDLKSEANKRFAHQNRRFGALQK